MWCGAKVNKMKNLSKLKEKSLTEDGSSTGSLGIEEKRILFWGGEIESRKIRGNGSSIIRFLLYSSQKSGSKNYY